MQGTTIGLDIAKNVIQVHGVDARGKVVVRKRLARGKVLTFFANLPRCVIGLEAGGGAHHWARELTRLGHDARLMPPQYVKAYVKAYVNQQTRCGRCRGLLRAALRVRQLLAMLGEAENDRIPPLACEVLQTLVGHLRDREARISDLDRRLVALTRSDPVCRALAAVPGVGPVIATAFASTVPDAGAFRSGRHLSAWLGLVPGQHRTAGKDRPLGLSKRGDGYLRRQLIHGARALVKVSRRREGKLWSWINGLLARRPFNVVVAAVANKLARIIWAMLRRGEAYRAA